MTQAITGSLDDALVHWNKLGCKGEHKRIRVLENASEAQGKSYFDLLTKNATNTNTAQGTLGPIIVKTMPDGSTIQFRGWATSADEFNTKATIEFFRGNYNSSQIKELKFNY